MDMSFLISDAFLYIREKLELVPMGDHMAELLFFSYVVVPIGKVWFTWISYVVVPIGKVLFTWIEDYLLPRIKKHLLAWIKKQLPLLDFLLYYNSNIENLRTQLGNLRITKNEVQGLVHAAEMHGEVILPSVERWQARAISITEDPVNLLDNELHLNPMVCYQRSKYATEKTAEVAELIQKGRRFDSVSTLRSRRSIFEDIMGALNDGEANRIGILGVGGVGKTFLANEIYEEAKYGDGDGDPFEKVVMVTISSHPDLRRIQCEIAEMLGLRFDELRTAGRARQLSQIFGEMRILIILDDIHKNFELEAVGIRFRGRLRGSKIVLVSQSQDACDQLGTEMDFKIEALDENEGWILFQRMAGVSLYSQNPSAVEAARNCAGLPRCIMTTAKAWKRNAALNL